MFGSAFRLLSHNQKSPDKGAKMIAVADHTGYIGNPKGIDAFDLDEHVKKTGGVKGYTKAAAISKEEFYKTKVDIFIPC